MHLTDSAVRRQLFLDVLDGTKALVSMSGIFHVPPQKKVLRSNSILTSGQVIGLHWPGTPEAAVGRQRSAAAVPAPGLSLCPTPVSSLLGKRGMGPKGALWIELESCAVSAHRKRAC